MRRAYASTGTRFVARRFTGKVNGREVPYYLGRGIEAHVLDTLIDHQPAPNVNSVDKGTLLNPINRGTGITDRESQRASMKYILLRLRVQLIETAPGTGMSLVLAPVTCRVILIYSTAPRAALLVGDFLTTPLGGIGDIATAGSQRIDSRESLQILYDNKFVLRNQNTARSADPTSKIPPLGDFTFRDLDLKLPIRRPVSFTAQSTAPITESDITSGALFLFTIFDNTADTNSVIMCTATGSCRLVFSP